MPKDPTNKVYLGSLGAAVGGPTVLKGGAMWRNVKFLRGLLDLNAELIIDSALSLCLGRVQISSHTSGPLPCATGWVERLHSGVTHLCTRQGGCFLCFVAVGE